jgi:hypothetical protein
MERAASWEVQIALPDIEPWPVVGIALFDIKINIFS